MKDSPVRIGSNADQLFSKILVCSTISHFEDDVRAQCLRCHGSIYIRPYSIGITVKLCGPCGMETLKYEPNSEVKVLPRDAVGFLNYLKQRKEIS